MGTSEIIIAVIATFLSAKEVWRFLDNAYSKWHNRKSRLLDIEESASKKLNEYQISVLEDAFIKELAKEAHSWTCDYVIVLNVVNGTYFIRKNGPVSELRWKLRTIHLLNEDEYDEMEKRIEDSFEQKPLSSLKNLTGHAKNVDGFFFTYKGDIPDKRLKRIMQFTNTAAVAGHILFNHNSIPETLIMGFWKSTKPIAIETLEEKAFDMYNFIIEKNTLLG